MTELEQLIAQLEKSQWWTMDQFEALQERNLVPLIKHHAKNSSHFSMRLAAQGLTPNSVLTIKGLQRLKTFGKREIQAAGGNFAAKNIPKSHLPLGEAQTSGSTGQPVKLPKGRLTTLYWQAHVIRDHQWYGREYTGRLASIRAGFNEYLEADSWGGPVPVLYGSGPAIALPVAMAIDQQLEYLEKFQPNIMIVHAGVLTGFVSEWERKGFTLPELKHVKNVGETVHDSLRERLRAVSGLEIEDNYSCSEVGSIAIQCPTSGLFHIMHENLIVEIINADGTSTGVGEIGRVVVTDLYNSAAPMIRYDTGDHAEVGPVCTCGRHGPTLKRIMGRDRGLFTRADGSRFWPQAHQYKLSKYVKLLQWQIVQHAIDDVEYKMVVEQAPSAEQKAAMEDLLGNAMGFPGQVRITIFEGTIPTPNGKYEETICLIK
jgi:phenylacetate-CoA ligase